VNFFYKILILIIFVSMNFYPDRLYEIVFATILAVVTHLAFQHSGEYPLLNCLQIAKEKFYKCKIRIKLYICLVCDYLKGYQKALIDNAIVKAKSTDESERKAGLEQLSQYGAEDDCVYENLLEILKNGLDKTHEKRVVEALCKIVNDMKNMNKW